MKPVFLLFLATGISLALSLTVPVSKSEAQSPQYDKSIPNHETRKDLGYFRPSFFAARNSQKSGESKNPNLGRNLEIIEQGHKVHKWAEDALLAGGEFENLLQRGEMDWARIHSLHISRLDLDLSPDVVASLQDESNPMMQIPISFSIGLEVPRATQEKKKNLRMTLDVSAIMELKRGPEVKVTGFHDSNSIEATIRKFATDSENEKRGVLDGMKKEGKSEKEIGEATDFLDLVISQSMPYAPMTKYFNGEFSYLVGKRVLENFLSGGKHLDPGSLDESSLEMLNQGSKVMQEILLELLARANKAGLQINSPSF